MPGGRLVLPVIHLTELLSSLLPEIFWDGEIGDEAQL